MKGFYKKQWRGLGLFWKTRIKKWLAGIEYKQEILYSGDEIVGVDEEVLFLKKRITELEKQLDNLRLSRRVLMDLLEQIEKEKNHLSLQLEKKTKNLKKYRKLNQSKIYTQKFELYELKDYLKK